MNSNTADKKNQLLATLQHRFDKNTFRHKGIVWKDVYNKLIANTDAIWIVHRMETTGGEPDVVGYDETTNSYIFYDCSAESPIGRRSFCYDREALNKRKANKPQNTATDVAAAIGIKLLNESDYRQLQQLGHFDTKTSSWIETPPTIRNFGGALFCDRRYNHVFVYHNGADSYYSARGFRGKISI